MTLALALPQYEFDFLQGISLPAGVVRRRTGIAWSTKGKPREVFRYRMDDRSLVRATAALPSEDLKDLRDVAVAVYVADRCAPRSPRGDRRPVGERGPRRISIHVPLQVPQRWMHPDTVAALHSLLFFLTGDDWTFVFSQRSPEPEHQLPLPHVPTGRDPLCVLYSGGLDSLSGVLSALAERPGETVLAVSVVSSIRIGQAQSTGLAHLRKSHSGDLLLGRLAITLSDVSRGRDDRESSQRSRGFLYLAAGILGASLVGAGTLRAVENGVGAINLPTSPEHLRTVGSRAVHPRTLQMFNGLIKGVLVQPIPVINPAQWMTKSQLLRQTIGSQSAKAAIQDAVSCDRSSYMEPGVRCGRCTSCLLRRMALAASGFTGYDGGAYQFDLSDPRSAWLPAHQLVPLYAMRDQVEQLRAALSTPGPSSTLLTAFPGLADVLATAPFQAGVGGMLDRLAQLFRAHVADWDVVATMIHRPGWGQPAPVTHIDVGPIAHPTATG
jgi:hypothetical protein